MEYIIMDEYVKTIFFNWFRHFEVNISTDSTKKKQSPDRRYSKDIYNEIIYWI